MKHPSQQFPFYKTFIDMQCRKDILVENQHVNKKMKARMTPFLAKMQAKAKENKFRLAYFFGFIVIFKLQPVYDCNYVFDPDIFCQNKTINWIYNNMIHYYTDFTNPIPQSALQTSKEAGLINKSPLKKKLADLFYKIDKHPGTVIGYNPQTESFVNSHNYEITFDQYLQLCANKYQLNYAEVQLRLKNVFTQCLL